MNEQQEDELGDGGGPEVAFPSRAGCLVLCLAVLVLWASLLIVAGVFPW